MASKKLIYADDARKAILREAPTFAYCLDRVKAVDAVEVVHGHWDDYSSKFDKGMDLRCSVCGNRADKFVGGTEDWYCLWKPNYCPNCGANMMDGDWNEY